MARAALEGGPAARLLEQSSELAAEVAKSRKPRFDLSDGSGGRLLVVTVPVFADGAPAGSEGDARPLVGVVALGTRPEASLYPLLADDAEPTRTGESLLVDLDAPTPAYLSQLRQPPAPDPAAASRSLSASARSRSANTFGGGSGLPVACQRVPPGTKAGPSACRSNSIRSGRNGLQ